MQNDAEHAGAKAPATGGLDEAAVSTVNKDSADPESEGTGSVDPESMDPDGAGTATAEPGGADIGTAGGGAEVGGTDAESPATASPATASPDIAVVGAGEEPAPAAHPTLGEVLLAIEELWPASLAEDWDAVGPVVGRPEREVKRHARIPDLALRTRWSTQIPPPIRTDRSRRHDRRHQHRPAEPSG